jgi:DNA gyrase subunit A
MSFSQILTHDTVDMVNNYDGTRKEPTMLPVKISNRTGQCKCRHRRQLGERHLSVLIWLKYAKPPSLLLKTLSMTLYQRFRHPISPLAVKKILYDPDEMQKNTRYRTRYMCAFQSRWNYDKANNCIEITEIPTTTTVEAIIEKNY